jgi:predicted anti-sigma-YlaC factor YlaD
MRGREEFGERMFMNCAEFQKVLPYIIETGGNAEEEGHLSSCAVCTDLVRDLRYIAEQAKLLLPMHDPSPQVWDNIQGSLEREGLVKPARARGRLLGSTGGSLRWIIMAVIVLLLVLGIALSLRGALHLGEASSQAQLTVGAATTNYSGIS